MGTGQGSAWKGGLAAFGVIAGAAIVYLAITEQPQGEAVTEPAQTNTAGATADAVPEPVVEARLQPEEKAVTVTTEEEEKPYTITADGVVDKGTYLGFKFYHMSCFVCHGPDGLGSTFAPALIESLKTLTYDDYVEVVINGRVNSEVSTSVMPSFGDDVNVMNHLDHIYSYLKARSDGALDRRRPRWAGTKVLD